MSEQEFDEQKDKEQKQMIERTRSTRFRHALDSEGEDEEPPSEYTSVCTERERKGILQENRYKLSHISILINMVL